MWYGEQLANMNVNPLCFSLKCASDVWSSKWYKKVMKFCSLVLLHGLIPFWSYHKHFYRQHVSDYPLNGFLGSSVLSSLPYPPSLLPLRPIVCRPLSEILPNFDLQWQLQKWYSSKNQCSQEWNVCWKHRMLPWCKWYFAQDCAFAYQISLFAVCAASKDKKGWIGS